MKKYLASGVAGVAAALLVGATIATAQADDEGVQCTYQTIPVRTATDYSPSMYYIYACVVEQDAGTGGSTPPSYPPVEPPLSTQPPTSTPPPSTPPSSEYPQYPYPNEPGTSSGWDGQGNSGAPTSGSPT